MTDDLSASIDHWVRLFQQDPALADEAARVVEIWMDHDGADPAHAVSILMAALGKYRDLSPAPDA
jgi:hypothetical protein